MPTPESVVWQEVLALIERQPIDLEQMELDAEYARRIGAGDQVEALSLALSNILRVARKALTDG